MYNPANPRRGATIQRSSANTETTQVPTTIFKVSEDHKRPFESKQPIRNRIHKVAVFLKLQPQSRSRDEQTTEIYHCPPTMQEATTVDTIFLV